MTARSTRVNMSKEDVNAVMASTAAPDRDQSQQTTDNKPGKLRIGFPDPSLGNNDKFVRQLTDFINAIYIEGESEFWKWGKIERCQPPEVRDLIVSGELALAWVQQHHEPSGASPIPSLEDVVGCIKIHMTDDKIGTFGMLTSAPAYRGQGVGRDLVQFAEAWASEHGAVMMQMELLFANGWHHPLKTRLAGWYERAGYKLVKSINMSDMFPDLATLLEKPCNLRVYQKRLS
ncbi:hypothetical protein V8F20_009946 [Naviculisporaceae sp. PSN 640]